MDKPFVMPNGRHKDVPITRVPVSYLKWMVQERHTYADKAREELDRRGTVTPDIEISGHAIDRASLRCRKIWHQDRGQEEGLHAWMVRRGMEAWRLYLETHGNIMVGVEETRQAHAGVVWVFAVEGVWPAVKSVWAEKE